MSFRLFVYSCMVWGGLGAVAGWLGWRLVAGPDHLTDRHSLSLTLQAGVGLTALPDLRPSAQLWQGLAVGATLGLFLGLTDALANFPARRVVPVLSRALAGLLLGAAGGTVAALWGESLDEYGTRSVLRLFAWMALGTLVGAGPGLVDVLEPLAAARNLRGGLRKLRNGLLGGALGGLLGGIAVLVLRKQWARSSMAPAAEDLWGPFVAEHAVLGCGIGLGYALVQVVLKDAWLKVEAGLTPGRQLILSRPETTLGGSGGCDVPLYDEGDLAPVHARVLRQGPKFVLADAETATGTFVNDRKIEGDVVLHAGDLIRLGRNTVLFIKK